MNNFSEECKYTEKLQLITLQLNLSESKQVFFFCLMITNKEKTQNI